MSQIQKPDGIHQFCRDIMSIDLRYRGYYRTELEEMFDSSIATEQSLYLTQHKLIFERFEQQN